MCILQNRPYHTIDHACGLCLEVEGYTTWKVFKSDQSLLGEVEFEAKVGFHQTPLTPASELWQLGYHRNTAEYFGLSAVLLNIFGTNTSL